MVRRLASIARQTPGGEAVSAPANHVWTVFSWSGRDYLVNACSESQAVLKVARAISGRPVKQEPKWSEDGRTVEIEGYEFHRPVKEATA